MRYLNIIKLCGCIIFIVLQSCNTIKPYYGKQHRDWETKQLPANTEVKHVVYLFGDAGEKEATPVFEVARKMIRERPDSMNTVAWLGDNVYYDGLPEPDESDRGEKEEVLMRQMRVTDSLFKGRTIFIPGNHDWNESHAGGLDAILRQEEFVEEYFDGEDIFIPSNGCAGPIVVDVNDELAIIVVDTEWWSHKFQKARYPDNGCSVEDRLDLIIQLEDAVRSNESKNIIIMGHHPIISNSNHGGHYNFLDHIFPLRLVRDHLYIPLPIIGSAYPILRKLGVSAQDIPSPEGQQWKNAIFSMAAHRPNVIYAAGHDHNLQLHRYNQMHHILSGSAAKTTFAARGFDATYVQQRTGFSRILYYEDGQVWVEYYVADDKSPEGELTFRSPLYSWKPTERKPINFDDVPDYTDSLKTIAASKEYDVGKVTEFFMGEHYREEWNTPVTIPYIDIKTFSGGLEPIKKGGGKQTLSLQLMNEDSIQFVLRSINKFPSQAIPEQFRQTWINDFVQDQISTAHPYGAFTIPKMADAIDIFYTRPKLVYTPHTPYLEQYINQFGGMMSMIEVRPDEDLSNYSRFGNSENVVSSETMFRHLREDNDNEVDQRLFLKTRLFDMLLGDWDRHEDQYRWAEYKKEKGSIFKPIPRDRDQVYAKYDGVLPWLLSRKWALRNFVNFDEEIDDIQGLNLVAQNMDRMLLSGLSRDEWAHLATQIKIQLSDYVIESAVRDMPPEVFPLSGEEIIRKLKARRDKIVETALEYYDFLTKEVYIVTSNKHERFEIKRHNDDSTTIYVYKIKKEGDIRDLLYSRSFHTKKTDEIRIFSRGGEDEFLIEGNTQKGITIRIVGGNDEDEFSVTSVVKDNQKSVYIYDNETGNIFNVSKDTKLIQSEEEWVNQFSRNLHTYDKTAPKLSLETNIDDGVLLGAGIQMHRNGFRADPYKSAHVLMAYHAFKTNAWRFKYTGDLYDLFAHTWDLELNGEFRGPNYLINYFGYGNNTNYNTDDPISFYRINLNSIHLATLVRHRFSVAWSLALGPTFDRYTVKTDSDGIMSTLTESEFNSTMTSEFAGVKFYSKVELTDKSIDPEKGLTWHSEAHYNKDLGRGDASFTSLSSDLSFYFTPNLPFRTTFASRLGGGTNLGDFYFYQSKFLDGTTNLRGYRRTRFAGRSNFYSNNEVRIKLFQIRSNLITGDLGAMAFYDIGKVWTKSEDSGGWHQGYGPGAYLNLYNLFVISGTYAISEEEQIFNFRFGFLF